MFRLLYRLLLQRLGIRRDNRRQQALAAVDVAAEVAAPEHPTGVGAGLSPAVMLTGLLAIAGLAVLTWQAFKLAGVSFSSVVDHAVLDLHIASSERWPVVVYLQGEDPGGDGSLNDTPPSASGKRSADTPRIAGTIESANGAFAPAFQVLPKAATVEIVNNDDTAHNTHVFNRGNTLFNVALPIAGRPVTKTLAGTGIFSVRCDIHPNMQGWVFVPPNRHYAVLEQPDSVRFSDLQPGRYVLHLWQATGAEHLRPITLTPGQKLVLNAH